jgi:hypothetical protein
MPLQQQYDLITTRAIIGMFFMELEAAQNASWTNELANAFGSNQSSETYAGLGNVPMLREWIGGKQSNILGEKSITITNKDWESTLRISNKDRRRDKTGQLQVRIGQLAQRAIQHKEKLLSQLVASGAASTYGLTWTGKVFFADDHAMGNGNVNDNNVSVDISALPTGDTTGTHGSVTAPSIGEMALSIQAGIQAMYGFVDDQGEPINQSAKQFAVMVPTTLLSAAIGAVTTQMLAGSMVNPLVASGWQVSVIPNARINTFTDKFVVFRKDGLLKPFIVQTEVEPSVKMLAEGSDYEFDNAAIKASVDWSGNVGYGSPDQAVLVTMT